MQNARWYLETALRAPKATRLLLDLFSRLGNVHFEITLVAVACEDILRFNRADFRLVFEPRELFAPDHRSDDLMTTVLSRGVIDFRIDFAADALFLLHPDLLRVELDGENGVEVIGDLIETSLLESGIVVDMPPARRSAATK
jgi:hypothetical protein